MLWQECPSHSSLLRMAGVPRVWFASNYPTPPSVACEARLAGVATTQGAIQPFRDQWVTMLR